MKFYTILGLVVTATFLSCEEKIELLPKSQSSIASFYKTQADIDQAVIAAYNELQSTSQYGMNFVYLMEVPSDNSRQQSLTNSSGIYGDFELFRVNPNNGVLNQTWASCYKGIQNCNIVLSRIDQISMDAAAKEITKGEVKFIRALTYFNLVRLWGDVPLVLTETIDPFDEFGHGRQDTTLIYNQVVTDLQEASQVLPDSPAQPGRATRGAALTLLGKVYLTLHNYDQAASTLATVVASNRYVLLPNFKSIFDVNNKNNAESIFEIQYKKGVVSSEGSPYANLFAPVGALTLVGGIGETRGDNLPTTDLYDSYTVGDIRRDAGIGIIAGAMYTEKYRDTPARNMDGGNNFIVLRYADVLLMLAEALNEQGYVADGEAFQNLNAVRERASLVALTSADVPSQQTFRLVIEQERRHELTHENHRWFDLVRTGRALEIMNAHTSGSGPVTVKPHHLYFPIPQSQVDADPKAMQQNVGY